MKNIFITGCGDGLGKTLLETSEECGYNVFPHFRENKNFISGDINKKNILEKLPKFLKMNSIDVFINNDPGAELGIGISVTFVCPVFKD